MSGPKNIFEQKPPHQVILDLIKQMFEQNNTQAFIEAEGSLWDVDFEAKSLFVLLAEFRLTNEHKNEALKVLMMPWEDKYKESDWRDWMDDPRDADGVVLRRVIEVLGGTPPPYPESALDDEVSGD